MPGMVGRRCFEVRQHLPAAAQQGDPPPIATPAQARASRAGSTAAVEHGRGRRCAVVFAGLRAPAARRADRGGRSRSSRSTVIGCRCRWPRVVVLLALAHQAERLDRGLGGRRRGLALADRPPSRTGRTAPGMSSSGRPRRRLRQGSAWYSVGALLMLLVCKTWRTAFRSAASAVVRRSSMFLGAAEGLRCRTSPGTTAGGQGIGAMCAVAAVIGERRLAFRKHHGRHVAVVPPITSITRTPCPCLVSPSDLLPLMGRDNMAADALVAVSTWQLAGSRSCRGGIRWRCSSWTSRTAARRVRADRRRPLAERRTRCRSACLTSAGSTTSRSASSTAVHLSGSSPMAPPAGGQQSQHGLAITVGSYAPNLRMIRMNSPRYWAEERAWNRDQHHPLGTASITRSPAGWWRGPRAVPSRCSLAAWRR